MPDPNLLILSDVHLGSDLVQHARPDAPARGVAAEHRDHELVSLLDWYRDRPQDGRPWRLVIAGDLVDFVGMSVSAPPGHLELELSDEERMHGLGSSVDHTLWKLRRVAEHHRDVFAALARFVASGNSLVVLRGNHDVDFHWEPVQAEFRAIIASHDPRAARSVEFSDWFYYEEGLIFVEHGHQYDDYCSHDHVLNPVQPSDPKRSYRSLSDILLRVVVRPTRGMLESGHDKATALDYFRFALRLGFGGMLRLAQRFIVAIATSIAVRREHFSVAAGWVRAEHERKMALLAAVAHISLTRLRALAKLQRPPVTRSLIRIIAGLMLDRVAMALVAVAFVVWVLAARWTPALGVELTASVALLAPGAWLWRRARGAIDATQSLREHAARITRLFPAAFVVMGHTHIPEVQRTPDNDATYVNLGAWAGEEPTEGAVSTLPPSQTHLIVCRTADKPVATLLRWDSGRGPEAFLSGRENAPLAVGSTHATIGARDGSGLPRGDGLLG